MKTTTVIISQPPLGTLRVAEALRMSVGLTLRDDAVQVLFVGDGVYALLQTAPEKVAMPDYIKHMETIKQLGHRIFAERQSLEARGIDGTAFDVEVVTRAEVAGLLLDSDGVIRY